MKIHLSPVVMTRAACNLFLMIFCIVGPIVFNLYFEVTGTERYFMPILGLFIALIAFAFLLIDIRRLTYVIVDGPLITSYSMFNKQLYTLDITKLVYYGIFKAQEDLVIFSEFIALSNERFEFEEDKDWSSSSTRNERKDWRNFINRYDLKEALVMPYTDKTKPLMRLDEWERIA